MGMARTRRTRFFSFLAVVLLTPFLTGVASAHHRGAECPTPQSDAALARTQYERCMLVRAVAPAVVTLIVEKRTPPPPSDPSEKDESPQPESLGSGFFVDDIIVTNHHVVDGAESIDVILYDGRKVSGIVLGSDKGTDIAVIAVDAAELPPAVAWGDSDAVRAGDSVIVIGNPSGLRQSVSAGVVSGVHRDSGMSPYDDLIQLDAALNPGNSGGPLFNVYGEVIGVNSRIFSPSGGSVGLGFAVPSNLAKKVVAHIMRNGYVIRGMIGVRIESVTEEVARLAGLPYGSGARVVAVVPESAAEAAGVKTGDVIISFDGQEIWEMKELVRVSAFAIPGVSVPVEVWREGTVMTLQITPTEMPRESSDAPGPTTEQQELPSPSAPPVTPNSCVIEGATLETITPELRTEFALPDGMAGVLTTAVESDSPASKAGLLRGDVVTGVDMKPVTTKGEACAIADAHKATGQTSPVLTVVRRGAGSFFLAIRRSTE